MIGKTILHYKILEKLGQGGMGVVYLAEDTKLERKVAIKFLPHRISANSEERQRFKIEAKAAAALNHPNIATIYAIEETENDLFIVMEFIHGKELKDIIKELHGEQFNMKDAINYSLQLLEGLEAAHNNGIIHRDIKSSNIMITNDGKVKIMDFGLAKVRGTDQLTKAGATLGTAAYMSPEQAKGEKIGQTTDIWSFGVVLFEMLTGELPFKAEYEQAVIYNILNEKQIPPSSLRSDISDSLNRIIDRCLEKNPSDRFQQTGNLIDELKSNSSVPKKTNSQKEKMISIAVLPFEDISPENDNKYFSDGLTEEIITKLSKLKKVRIISRTSVMNYNRTGKTMKQIASELNVHFVIEGSVRKFDSDLRITTQLIDAEKDANLWADIFNGTTKQIFDFQENVASKIVKALKINLSPEEKKNLKRKASPDTEAYQYYLKGRYFWGKRNIKGFETAIKYFEKAIKIDENYALAWSGIADTYNLISDHGTISREKLYPKAKAAVQKALELDKNLSEAHASLASLIMLHDWNWKNSLKEFKLAIKLNQNNATAHHWYSEWLMFNGMMDEAGKEIEIAAQLDPLSAAVLHDKGIYYYYSRNYNSAIEHANKTLELEPNLIASYRLLSLSYLAKGMFEEAIAENKRWMGHNANPDESAAALAYCYASAGMKEDAIKIVDDFSKKEKLNGNTVRGIALVHIVLGNNNLAFKWLERAFHSRAESLFLTKIDPKLDPIRSDPRFNSFIERIGFIK